MDGLEQMLTDPLELVSGGVVNGIMEECLLGGTRVSLPEDLLEDPEIFFDVVSGSTWDEVLSESQREHLRKFLPHLPENEREQQNGIISDLFEGENFRFGNPLHIAQKLFRDGHFNPEVVKYRRLCVKSQYKRYLYSQQHYFHKLLKQILVSRKELLELARKSGPDASLRRKYRTSVSEKEEEKRAQRRYEKILREVKEECEDNTISSDEEGEEMCVCVLSLCVCWLCGNGFYSSDHPDLATGDLTLSDIIARVNTGRRGSLAALLDFTLPKKKVKEKEERKKKKLKVIKTEPEDLTESSGAEGPLPPPPESQPQPRPLAIADQKARALKMNSVFLFPMLFTLPPPQIEEKVLEWQISAASALNLWYSVASNWTELVLPALRFLAGESTGGLAALPPNFTPYVSCRERGQWKWIGSSRDSEQEITSLCLLWLETKQQVFPKVESEELADVTPPTPRVRTDYVVRPSTGEEKRVFQEQERQRYSQPHKAFTFRMHGFESMVGPVKGVFDKDPSLNKAREHSLLRSDRPAYVTILSLVRDAAARLPNGEGTRAEICELLKDSQFLAPEVTSAQINTVVSGALDRLHYEKDPCVKYDIGRKLWIYLHRNRSEEEFGELSVSQAGVASTTVLPSGKESGGKASACEQLLPDPSLPPTPLTPGPPATPTTPVTPTLPVTPTSPPASAEVSKNPTTSAPDVLLVSSPTMPQLSTLLSAAQPGHRVSTQPQARVVSHSLSGSLPQVRVLSSQKGLPSSAQQASVVQQVQQQIRLPTVSSVMTVPVKAQTGAGPVQIQQSAGKTITVSGIGAASKTVTSAISSTASTSAATIIQSVSGQSIVRQVAISGQLGMKGPSGTGIPLTATNIRIQGKDVLRLAPSSITTDSKGQTVLRITQDMMATLTKAPVTTVKLTPDMLGAKGISATLHMNSKDSVAKALTKTTTSSSSTMVKVTSDLKATEASANNTAIRLMPALAMTVADQKGKAGSAPSSTDTKPAATIRIMPGLGVIPQKAGQTISVTSGKQLTSAKPAATVTTASVALAAVSTAGATTVTMAAPGVGRSISIGKGTATVRQVPVSATVVSTSQATKLPATITVPLSVLNQPLKGKGLMAGPIIKGNLGANISGLGRNIILTTMPAGTKLLAGNKPVSFVTAQQLQQLQQQGQATQVRIQHVSAQQLHSGTAVGSTKPGSTMVVTTAPSMKQTQDQ
uniref:Nuclear factor related to kappaB binding protein n=1 Tax=Callorhinchus milii TaxID=7868 RepID=A0A4W3H1W3_CALMI